jgi:predicted nucleotidyltransferase
MIDRQPITKSVFARLVDACAEACRTVYGDRLVSMAVFGSVGRGAARPDSDIDLLIVASPLPDGRIPRMQEFEQVEVVLRDDLLAAARDGVATRLSPIVRTPAEVDAGSPLLLDMVDDAQILLDRDGFLAGVLQRLRERLAARGARRVWRGNAWYWDLMPDYRPGDVFDL